MDDGAQTGPLRGHQLKGILYCSLGLIFAIALLGYRPEQCPWISTEALRAANSNPIGIIGTYLSFAGLAVFGLAYLLFPLFLLRAGLLQLAPRTGPMGRNRLYAMLCCIFGSPIVLAQVQQAFLFLQSASVGHVFLNGLGGWIGTIFYENFFLVLLGRTGTFLSIAILVGFSLWGVFTSRDSLGQAIDDWLVRSGSLGRWLRSTSRRILKLNPLRFLWRDRTPTLEVFPDDLVPALQAVEAEVVDRGITAEEERIIDEALLAIRKPTRPAALGLVEERGEDRELGPYLFPPLDLLAESREEAGDDDEDGSMAEALKETLSQFGVEVTIEGIQKGPVITRFKLSPAPGVRVEKIENLDKNIALTLKAPSVRIQAPIPGQSYVGIEIPKLHPQTVSLRGILESVEWAAKTVEIPIVLGRGVTGEPLIADLARMPHLLIAGSTGSGKTACLNSILTAFLYHASPDDLRLILVDPKIVEMQVYNQLPHMLLPTLTEPQKVPTALRWLIREMERRYHQFAAVGVRNIAGFNARVTRRREESEKAKVLDRELSPEERAAMANLRDVHREDGERPQKKLPYIVCVIDELADLMLVAPDDIENSVTRLAQLARAAGIHLILATQRPSVNVITGVIKANLPSRIAFKVASKVDSRTILDGNGADSLIGRGDMLFLPPGSATLMRAQGAWVSDEEVNGVVNFLARNGPPNFDQDALNFLEHPDGELIGNL